MKKIIATVLAMVMALALCTTAFAASIPVWTTSGSTANVDLFDGQFNTKFATGSMKFFAAKAPTVNSDGDVTDKGNIAYYVFEDATTHALTKYILANNIPTDADASKYVLVKNHDNNVGMGVGAEANQTGKNQTLLMKEVSAVYYFTAASIFNTWGDKCGQYADPKVADMTYVSYTDDDATVVSSTLGTAVDTDWAKNVVVAGEVYTLDTALTAKAHSWTPTAWDKDGVATEFTCVTCKTVGKVVNSPLNAPAGSTVERIFNTDILIAFTYTPGTTTPTTGTATSPKTFDAGIAMYVGMALTSVAGSAVVIGKKKEF